MDIHENARLTVHGRARIVGLLQNGYGVAEAAEMSGVTGKTVRKWRDRFRAEGPAGLQDRSSRPHQPRHPTPIETVQQIEALRRQRMPGKEIAAQVGVSPSTVSRVLQRLGLNKLSALEPAQPTRRYERERPGELIHIDIKKLGRFDKAGHRAYGERREEWRNRGAGWEFVHVAIDDASRIAFSRIMKSERKACAVAFLKAMVAYYKSLGIAVEQIMTDNGACYRARSFRTACKRLGLRHIYTRPYTPRTNGKAERFIQTALREWAYAKAYDTSRQRAADLPIWLHRYNWHRPHGSIGYRPPVSKLGLAEDNLLRLHT